MPVEQETFSYRRTMVFKLCLTQIFPWRRQCQLWGHGMSWVGRWGFTQFVGTGDGVWHLSVWQFPAQHSCHPSLEKVEESILVLKVEESTHHTDVGFHKGIFVLTKCGPKVFLLLPCSRPGISSTTKPRGLELRMTQKFKKTQ